MQITKEYLENLRKQIVNPEDLSWDDTDFDSNDYNTIEEALELSGYRHGEFDEGQQAQLQLIDELIDYLEQT